METYIDKLLTSRHLTSPLPLWKLHLTDNEVDELVGYIKKCINQKRLSKHFSSEMYDRELCLLCSIWWNRKYAGGRQNYSKVLQDYEIEVSEAESQKIRTYIIDGLYRLNIPVHQTACQNRYLDSVYAQGGLPIKLMTNDETRSTFENFLKKLISRLDEIAPQERERHALDFAQNAADICLNNETLRASKAVMEFAVEVANAYLNGDDTFDDYDAIRDIMTHIRQGKENNEKGRKFRAEWYFRIFGEQLSLFYQLDGPCELAAQSEDGNAKPLSILVNGQRVASYYECGQRHVIMPGARLGHMFACTNPTAILDFKAMKEGIQKYNYQLLNAEPPYLDEPLLLRYDTNRQAYGKKGNGNYALLLPPDWRRCDELPEGKAIDELPGEKTVALGDRKFRCIEGIEAKTIDNGTLEFCKAGTNERLRIDRHTTDISVLFSPNCEDWIEESSTTLAMNETDISRRFFFYDQEDKIIQRRNFTFKYRLQGDGDFHEYNGGSLPDGRITMRVCDKEGRAIKTFRFVNLHGLTYVKGEDSVTLTYQAGTCTLLSGQEQIEKQDENTYTVVASHKDTAIASANIRLRVLSNANQPLADISVPSPLRKNGFATMDGQPIPNGTRIAYDDLYKYQAVLTEDHRNITIIFLEERYQKDKYLKDKYLKDLRIQKKDSFRAGSYSLDRFKDVFDSCIAIYGFSDNHKFFCLSIDNTQSIYIYRHSYQARQSIDENGCAYVSVTSGSSRDLVLGLQLIAIPLEVYSSQSPLYRNNEIVLEERDGAGKYYLPKEYAKDGYSFKVVSDNNRDQGSLLPYNFSPHYSDKKESSSNEAIQCIAKLLQNNTEDAWRDLWFYMHTIIRYRLPYSTFTPFFAVSQHPDLLAKMIVRIGRSDLVDQYQYDFNTIISELQRMESELGFAFHYVPIDCWKKEYECASKQYDSLSQEKASLVGEKNKYVQGLFDVLKELLKRQFGDEYYSEIFNRLTGGASSDRQYGTKTEYYGQANSALVSFDVFDVPKPYLPDVELPPNIPWENCSDIVQKLSTLAIILPQSAAQYAHGADMNLWKFDKYKNFIRRMINYMRLYTPELYCELFTTALLREPVTQTTNR